MSVVAAHRHVSRRPLGYWVAITLVAAAVAVGVAVGPAGRAGAVDPCVTGAVRPTCLLAAEPSPLTAPGAPSDVRVTVVARTAVTISWVDRSTTESVFQVVRSDAHQSSTFFVPARPGAGGHRSFTDTGVAPGTSYTYRVRAVRYATAADQALGASGFVSVRATTDRADAPVDLGLPMPVGSQGTLNDCSAWAADYYLRGWYAWRDGYYPRGGFAPTYTYAQYDHGRNNGTTIYDNLSVQLQDGANGLPGLAPLADYPPGLYDSRTQPGAAVTARASDYRIASISQAYGANLQPTIQDALSSGQPLALSIDLFPDFVSPHGPTLIGSPPPGEDSTAGHSVFAYAFDATGVWVANQWSTAWRRGGTAELSWAFVNDHVSAAVGITPVTPAGM